MVWKGLVPVLKQAPILALQNVDKTKVLFAAGAVGVVGTGVAAAKASPAAAARIDEIQWDDFQMELTEGEHRKYRLKRYALEVAPLYLPAFISGAGAIMCFGISNKQLAMKAAGYAAAAGVAEKMFESYSEKAMVELGEEAHEKIMKAMADDIPDEVMEKARGYLTQDDVANLYPHTNHDTLWYDVVMDRMFWATEAKILDAESKVNQQIISEQVATISDFYDYLQLESDGSASRALGWTQYDSMVNSMSIIIGSKMDPVTHIPMNSISYRWVPVYPREGSN